MRTKEFRTEDVIGAITGVLLRDIGAIYEVLTFMSGESVYTHQLPRVGREALPVVLAAHPELEPVVDEVKQVDRTNYRTWVATWVERYGPTITVPLMNEDAHERIDPLSELAEMIHPDKIIVAEVPDAQ